MHPDAIIAGLRRELERLDPSADDYTDRRAAIEAEIDRVDALERPVAQAEDAATVFDRDRAYLDGLKLELERAEEDRRDEIQAEINRVEQELSARPEPAEEVPVAAQEAAPAVPVIVADPQADPTAGSGSEPESGLADAGQE